MSAQRELGEEVRKCKRVKNIKKCGRIDRRNLASDHQEESVLRRALSQGLAHPKLQNTSKKSVSQTHDALPKGEVLKLILSRLRLKPGTQARYLTRLEKIRKQKQQPIKQEKPYELCCSVCIDLLLQPMVLPCGHGFCRKCIEISLNYKRECPLCRDPLREGEPALSLSLQQIVKNHLSKMTDHSLKTIYEARQRDAQTSRKFIKPESLQIGARIDLLTQRNIWYDAQVIRTLVYDGQPHIVLRYKDLSRHYEEMISVSSERLAPNKTHTFNHIEQAWRNMISESQISIAFLEGDYMSDMNESMLSFTESDASGEASEAQA